MDDKKKLKMVLEVGFDCWNLADLGRYWETNKGTLSRRFHTYCQEELGIDPDELRLGHTFLLTRDGVEDFAAWLMKRPGLLADRVARLGPPTSY